MKCAKAILLYNPQDSDLNDIYEFVPFTHRWLIKKPYFRMLKIRFVKGEAIIILAGPGFETQTLGAQQQQTKTAQFTALARYATAPQFVNNS